MTRLEPPFFGLVKDRPETELSPTEFSHAKDVVLDKHRIAKRRGSVRVSFFTLPGASIAFEDDDQFLQSEQVTETEYSSHALGTQFTVEICGRGSSDATHTFMAMLERGYWRSQAILQTFGWTLYFDRLNKTFHFGCFQDSGTDILFTGTYTAYAPEKPYHLVVRRDGSNAWMYLNDGDFSGKIGEQTGLSASSVETHTVSALEVGRQVTGFAPGAAPSGGFRGRLAEFRTWDYAISTNHVDEYLLESLPPHVRASNSLRFYIPMNEGVGPHLDDVGVQSRTGTETSLWRLARRPSIPYWVPGLSHGGFGDWAVRFDGREDFFSAFSVDDIYGAFRTGTSDWAVELLCRPLPVIRDDSVIAHMGYGTFTPGGAEGFAFQVGVDGSDETSKKFRVRLCTATDTFEIVSSSAFTHGKVYGIHVQRQTGEARLRIDNITDDTDGAWETITMEGDAPGFGEGAPLLLGASFPLSTTIPDTGFAAVDIDEVRLWESARFSDLRSVLASRNDDELIGYWPFQDGDGGQVTDASKNRNDGDLWPKEPPPPWKGGIVTPLFGPEVEGAFYYQRSESLRGVQDARERTLIAAAGPSLYRQEGLSWQEVRTSLTPGNLWSGAQLGSQLILVNGLDDNLLFDGVEVWDAGLDPPEQPATAQVTGLTNQGPWDEVDPLTGKATSVSARTAKDLGRTEPTGQFDGKRIDHGFSTGTISTRVFRYLLNRIFRLELVTNLSGVSGFGADQFWIRAKGLDTVTMNGAVVTKGIPPGGLEGAFFQCKGANGSTETFTVIQDGFSGQALPGGTWNRWIKCNKASTLVNPIRPTDPENILQALGGHFIWESAIPAFLFTTTSYDISLFDAGVTGPYFYRYTNYNRYTEIESDPSPPIDGAVEPNSQAVIVSIPPTNDGNATDRLVYRTRFQGGGPLGKGEAYYLVGTSTGTGTDTFYDVTPDGQEGRLISFFRTKPPRSYLCHMHRGRMFYVPVATPNRVYFSEVTKPAEVDDFNWRQFGEANDHITGLVTQNDNLIVFKRRSIWALLRTDVRGAMRTFQVYDGIGCVSHHSIATLPDGSVIFLSDNGVYQLSGFQLTRVSDGTVQYYFDRLDPDRLDRAVGIFLKDSGIYRLNVSPFSLYATTVVQGRNSWHLDFHFGVSRQVQRPVWTYGEREVSFYGRFVSEDGVEYPIFGDYMGFVQLDNLPEMYTDGLGWYRDGTNQQFQVDALNADADAGTYTVNVSDDLFAKGDRLKGLRVVLKSSSASETHTVARSFTNTIILESALSNSFSANDQVLVAPINSRFVTGWLKIPGSARSGKKLRKMQIAHLLSTTTATMKSEARRLLSGSHEEERAINLGTPKDLIEMSGRGLYYRLDFEHDAPGERFELFSVDFDVETELER